MAKEERKEREGIWLSIGSDRDDDRSRKYTSKKMKSKFEFYYDDSSSEDEEEQVFKNYSIDKLLTLRKDIIFTQIYQFIHRGYISSN